MKEAIYQWMKNLAVFYILFTAVLHLVPDTKYERYVRFFMGLLLVFMMCTPVFAIFGRGEELAESFGRFYMDETHLREQEELDNLQELYLQRGYEQEMRQRIRNACREAGVELSDAEVRIREGNADIVLYVEPPLTEAERRRIADGLWEFCEIREDEYEIRTAPGDEAAVGGDPAGGASSDRGGASGVRP